MKRTIAATLFMLVTAVMATGQVITAKPEGFDPEPNRYDRELRITALQRRIGSMKEKVKGEILLKRIDLPLTTPIVFDKKETPPASSPLTICYITVRVKPDDDRKEFIRRVEKRNQKEAAKYMKLAMVDNAADADVIIASFVEKDQTIPEDSFTYVVTSFQYLAVRKAEGLRVIRYYASVHTLPSAYGPTDEPLQDKFFDFVRAAKLKTPTVTRK